MLKQKIITASETEKARYLAEARAGGLSGQESATGMLIPIQDNGDWRPILPDPEHPDQDHPADNMTEHAWRALGIDPETLSPDIRGDNDWQVVIGSEAVSSSGARERARMRMAYEEALAKAADDNPGPHLGQLRIGAIPGTHFAGNGTNDLANIANALAKAYGVDSIIVNNPLFGRATVSVDLFIDSTEYRPEIAAAMLGMVEYYWSDVGYDPAHPERFDRANDWANAVPTREVDMAAYRHDFLEIWFAGNPSRQMRVNRELHDQAMAAVARNPLRWVTDHDAVRWDLAIAQFASVAMVAQPLVQPARPQPLPASPRP